MRFMRSDDFPDAGGPCISVRSGRGGERGSWRCGFVRGRREVGCGGGWNIGVGGSVSGSDSVRRGQRGTSLEGAESESAC